MSGMIPGVGVPHRRRMSPRVHMAPDDPYHLRERYDSSTDLSETALRARQRLEERLSSCLQISSRSNNLKAKTSKGSENSKRGSSKLVNKVDESESTVCFSC